EMLGRDLDLLAVVDGFADAHVEHDLLEPRHLHAVLVAELLGELLAHRLLEHALQPRRSLRVARKRLAGSLDAFGLGALALGTLLGLLARSRCSTLLGLRSLVRLRGLLGLRLLLVGISHRSLLPNASQPGPSCRPPSP